MKNGEKLIANPYVMLREEFDDWAVLFNPDSGHGFGLSPTGVYVWKLLDGEHAIDELLEELRDHAEDVPKDAREHIRMFVDELVGEGLAGCGDSGFYRKNHSRAPLAGLNVVQSFTYEAPRLVNLSSGQTAHGDCNGGSSAGCCGTNGHMATACYTNGNGGGGPSSCSCNSGGCDMYNSCVGGGGTGTPACWCYTGCSASSGLGICACGDCPGSNGGYMHCGGGSGGVCCSSGSGN